MESDQQIYHLPDDVHSKLHELGLSVELLRPVWEAMFAAKASCTEFDVPNAGGSRAYMDGMRRLREVLVPRGWIAENRDNASFALNPAKRVRLAVMNTDGGTGLTDSIPKPTSRKGKTAEAAASKNRSFSQPDLTGWDEILTSFRPPDTLGLVREEDAEQWYVMVHCRDGGVRVEVSLPVLFEDGHFTSFRERIIVPVDEDGPDVFRRKMPDIEPDFDVPVTRKEA